MNFKLIYDTCPQLKKSPVMKDRLAVDLSVSVREGSPAMSDSLGMWWPRDVVITSEDGDIELDKATLSDDTSSARRWLERPVFPLPPPFLPDFVKSGGTDCAAGTGLLAGKLDDVLFNLAGLMMCCWCFGRWDTLLGEMCRLVLVGDLTWDVVFGRTEPLVDYLQFFFKWKRKPKINGSGIENDTNRQLHDRLDFTLGQPFLKRWDGRLLQRQL